MAGMMNPPPVPTGPAETAPSPGADGAPTPGAGAAPTGADDTRLSDDETGGSAVTPEEQDAYDAFVTAGYRLIYSGGKVNPGILKLLDDDPKDIIAILGEDVAADFSPVIALAATAAIVALEVVRRAPEKPDGEIILHAGKELLEELAMLSEKAGVHNYTQDELNQAMLHATNLYRITATQAGMVDEHALSEEFAEILNAQDQGKLGKILPGLERYDDNGSARQA